MAALQKPNKSCLPQQALTKAKERILNVLTMLIQNVADREVNLSPLAQDKALGDDGFVFEHITSMAILIC